VSRVDLVVPDLGSFSDVPVIDVLVKPGDAVEVDTPLITLETDKAAMDVPSTAAGKIVEITLKRGDKVSKGTLIARVETDGAGAAASSPEPSGDSDSTRIQPAPSSADASRAQSATADRDRAAKSAAGNGAATESDRRAPARPETSGDTVRMPMPGSSAAAKAEAQRTAHPESRTGDVRGAQPEGKGSEPRGPQPEGGGAADARGGPAEASGGAARAPSDARGAEARAPQPGGEARAPSAKGGAPAKATDTTTPTKSGGGSGEKKRLLVLGAGPGGYTAAFRAADLGLQVTLVERWSSLGGVCLNVGCIPSKALLHAAKVIEDVESMSAHGVSFGAPTIDLGKLRDWKTSVVKKLTNGLKLLARQRKVEVVQGTGKFVSPNAVEVAAEDGKTTKIDFDYCVIAAGSEPIKLPNLPDDPRIMDSTGALELPPDVKRLLVIGGGIIGLEMATVYDALGVKVSVCELTPGLMPGCDPDLVRPLEKRLRARYEAILVGTKCTGIEARKEGLRVTFEGAKAPEPQVYDRVLVAVGRVPNGKLINAEAAGVKVTDRGFIPVDKQMRTNVPHIFAIGDIVGQPMLAHKAMHEAKVAAEVAAGEKRSFDVRAIPSVAYTDPEVAWAGLTETEAQAKGIPYKKGAFPWVASGRSLSLGRDEGFTKVLFDPESHRVLGAGIVGPNAGELIAELVLGIEMGVDATDIGLSIHPHPTLSETVGLAAEAFEGTLTDLYIPKR
jgi:dihydrolipoamide dehydrogenase